LREAENRGVSIFVLRSNTVVQMVNLLRDLLREIDVDEFGAQAQGMPARPSRDEVTRALFETEEAINQVMDGGPAIELQPQSTYIRRLQHQLAERYNLGSRSTGEDPHRRVEIYRRRASGD
jgi:hypothetical protein